MTLTKRVGLLNYGAKPGESPGGSPAVCLSTACGPRLGRTGAQEVRWGWQPGPGALNTGGPNHATVSNLRQERVHPDLRLQVQANGHHYRDLRGQSVLRIYVLGLWPPVENVTKLPAAEIARDPPFSSGVPGPGAFQSTRRAGTRKVLSSVTTSVVPVRRPAVHPGVEQLAARQAHNLEVEGSSPSPGTRESDGGFTSRRRPCSKVASETPNLAGGVRFPGRLLRIARALLAHQQERGSDDTLRAIVQVIANQWVTAGRVPALASDGCWTSDRLGLQRDGASRGETQELRGSRYSGQNMPCHWYVWVRFPAGALASDIPTPSGTRGGTIDRVKGSPPARPNDSSVLNPWRLSTM